MNAQTKCNLDVIHKTDCVAFMQRLPSESVDLIVTDPPYLMNYKTRRRKDKRDKFCSAIIGDTNEQLITDYIKECYRILKNNSACYMFCNANKVEFFKAELKNAWNRGIAHIQQLSYDSEKTKELARYLADTPLVRSLCVSQGLNHIRRYNNVQTY